VIRLVAEPEITALGLIPWSQRQVKRFEACICCRAAAAIFSAYGCYIRDAKLFDQHASVGMY
jgi:hypothetical protein